jgi:hypothetical protein
MTKPSASRIERKIEQLEAKHWPKMSRWERGWRAGRILQITIDEGYDEAEAEIERKTREAQEKALAEHIAAHPEHAGYTVEDFFWIVMQIQRPPPGWDGDVNPWYEQRKADAKRAAEAGGSHLSGEEAARPGDAAARDGPYSEHGRDSIDADPEDRPGARSGLRDQTANSSECHTGPLQAEVAQKRRVFPPRSRFS